MKQRYASWLLFLFCCLSGGFAGAHTGSVRGIIYGAYAAPLEGAVITVKGAAASGVSDAAGRFLVKVIPAGRVVVMVARAGYRTLSEVVAVEDGVTTEVVLTLEPGEVRLGEVAVSAQKDNSIAALRGAALDQRPVNSSQDLLRLVPGLFTAQHQGGGKAEQLFLRGFDADHGTDINISVDGMPVNMVSHAHGQGFADNHFIIPESVQELDYGKGPYQADKGNLCTAGWAAFKTRNSLPADFVKTEAGMYGYFRTVAGISLFGTADSAHRRSGYVMGEYGYNRGYFDQPQNFQRFNLMGKYTSYITPSSFVTLTLSGFGSGWDASGQLPTRAIAMGLTDRFGQLDEEGGLTSRFNANVQYYKSTGADYFKSNLWATAYKFHLYSDFTYYLTDSVNGDQIRQAEQRVAAGYNAEYGHSSRVHGIPVKTAAGVMVRYDNVTNDELSHTIARSVTLNPIALGDVHETNMAAWVSAAAQLTPRLTVSAALRGDYLVQQYIDKLPSDNNNSQPFINHVISPKARAAYRFNDQVVAYYNYGTGFHSNDTRTLAIGSNPAYAAVYGHAVAATTLPLAFSHDLGINYRPGARLALSAAVWRMDLQREFTYNGDESNVTLSGATRRTGLDLAGRYVACKWLALDADVNIAVARFRDSAQGYNYVPLAPGVTATGGATFVVSKHLNVGLRFRHMGDRPATTDGGIVAPGYTLLDAVTTYTTQRIEVGLQIQNLTNVRWDEAAFATQTRLQPEVAAHMPGTTDLCITPGTPLFVKVSVAYKF